MSHISFENYGILADSLTDFTQVAGRYFCQRDDEKRILLDVVRKLELSVSINLLEIGCGAGNLLIPLSFLVREVTGIDHPSCVAVLQERYHNENFTVIGANFLNWPEEQVNSYQRILIYSVLHYLGEEDVQPFINKAISLLRPGGKMLLGDIPNISKKKRFLTSKSGKQFFEKWNHKMAAMCDSTKKPLLKEDNDVVQFDDVKILTLLKDIREVGCNAYLMPQPVNLPFGYTREDILVEKPE